MAQISFSFRRGFFFMLIPPDGRLSTRIETAITRKQSCVVLEKRPLEPRSKCGPGLYTLPLRLPVQAQSGLVPLHGSEMSFMRQGDVRGPQLWAAKAEH